MAEDLIVTPNLSKAQQYQALYPQVQALVVGENNYIANAANIAAALKQAFGFWWVGFYFVEGNELVLGPFQGPVACTRIALGRGVCGKAWQLQQPIVVPNVDEFEGHIACSSASKSEVVLPLLHNKTVLGVLDVDSEYLNHFDDTDVAMLQPFVQLLIPTIVYAKGL